MDLKYKNVFGKGCTPNWSEEVFIIKKQNNTTTSVISKTDLAARETRIYKMDLDKLKTVPADLSKLSNVVNNYAIKKLCISIDYQI